MAVLCGYRISPEYCVSLGKTRLDGGRALMPADNLGGAGIPEEQVSFDGEGEPLGMSTGCLSRENRDLNGRGYMPGLRVQRIRAVQAVAGELLSSGGSPALFVPGDGDRPVPHLFSMC